MPPPVPGTPATVCIAHPIFLFLCPVPTPLPCPIVGAEHKQDHYRKHVSGSRKLRPINGSQKQARALWRRHWGLQNLAPNFGTKKACAARRKLPLLGPSFGTAPWRESFSVPPSLSSFGSFLPGLPHTHGGPSTARPQIGSFSSLKTKFSIDVALHQGCRCRGQLQVKMPTHGRAQGQCK